MSFIKWLQKFSKQNNSIGDFSRDVACDRGAPVVDDRQAWLNHLEARNACDAAVDTFGRAWARYVKERGCLQ